MHRGCRRLSTGQASPGARRSSCFSMGSLQRYGRWALQAGLCQTFAACLLFSSFCVFTSQRALSLLLTAKLNTPIPTEYHLTPARVSWKPAGLLVAQAFDTRLSEFHPMGAFIFLHLICLHFHLCSKLCFWVI